MSAWAWLWLAWAAAGLALELVALLRPAPGDTLSEQVWLLLAQRGVGKFLAWMLTAFLLWLAFHFVTRGRLG